MASSLLHHRYSAARRRKPRFLSIITFILLALTLTACGNVVVFGRSLSGSGPGSSTGSLPGTEEFGLSMAQLVDKVERIEAQISQCMSEAGFEYIANDFNTIRRGMVADKSLPGMTERGFIERHGFGIATMYTGAAPQLADSASPARIGIGQQNTRIFQGLSPEDQVAYNRTLFGDHLDATLAVALEIEDFSRTGGCTRAAIEQEFNPDELKPTYLNPLDALIEQDSRMQAALGEFSECVRAAGFDYSHPNDVEDDIKNRLDEITGGAPVESLSSENLQALAQLQDYERAAAIVAFDCESRILDPVEDRIERELY